MEYYAAPFAAIWMDLENIHSVKQVRERQTSLTCGILKIIPMNLYIHNRNRFTDTENKLTVTKAGREGRRDKLRVCN